MKTSFKVLVGDEVDALIDDLKSCLEYYESCKEGVVKAQNEDAPAAIFPSEGAASALRWIIMNGEKIRRIMQPHWMGFEEGDVVKQITADEEWRARQA